jgi:hypothetical protein
MLTAAPEGHDARGREVTWVRMVVSDCQAPGHDEPIRRSGVVSPLLVAMQDRVFNVRARDAQ